MTSDTALDPSCGLARAGIYGIGIDQAELYAHRVNKWLWKVIWALNESLEDDILAHEIDALERSESRWTDMGYIQEQIDYIHRLYDKGVSKLELRFHSSRTEAPLYFLSNFVVKGLVLHESAAGKYPWLMFVDDPSQKEDVYDTLSRDYHKIWKHASPVPRGFDLLFAREEDLAVPTPGIEFRNDVFISYSSKNVDLALEISEDLEEAGINTYLSQVSIQAGTEWKPDIRDALQRSKIILPILTRAAVESRWVIGETFAMWALGKPIIPARAGVEQEDLPEYLRDFQSIDIMTRKGRKALVDSVLGLVDDRSGENEQP